MSFLINFIALPPLVSKSYLNKLNTNTTNFDIDCYRYLFINKALPSKDKVLRVVERADYNKLSTHFINLGLLFEEIDKRVKALSHERYLISHHFYEELSVRFMYSDTTYNDFRALSTLHFNDFGIDVIHVFSKLSFYKRTMNYKSLNKVKSCIDWFKDNQDNLQKYNHFVLEIGDISKDKFNTKKLIKSIYQLKTKKLINSIHQLREKRIVV